jgi:hypothetical protein
MILVQQISLDARFRISVTKLLSIQELVLIFHKLITISMKNDE